MAYWYRRVFLLAVPLILSNLTQPLLSTVDTILSGHLPGAAALGGVAVGGIFFNAVFWTFGFLRMGTTGLVAQAHGAQDDDALRLHFLRAMLSALLIGAVVLALRGPLIALAIQMLGASAEVHRNAEIYCHIRIWSAPAALANYAILGYLLGRQRARTALLLQAAINMVNVAVALWLVMRLHWGVAGIATATLTADWTGCLLGLALTRQAGAHPSGRLHWAELADGPSLRHLFALNRDILLRTVGLVAAYACFTRAGARAGDATLAANAVLMNLHFIASYGLDGFANATEALVGEAVGARRVADYRAVLRASTVSAFAVAALVSLAYAACGDVYESGIGKAVGRAFSALGNRAAPGFGVGISVGRHIYRRDARPRSARQHVAVLRSFSAAGNCAGAADGQSRSVVRLLRVQHRARTDARFAAAAGGAELCRARLLYSENRRLPLAPLVC